MDIKILVAAHKPYDMPHDVIYMPISVGACGNRIHGFAADDTGDNISAMTGRFCELTASYWAWKNLTSDYCGLVHYRRHFTVQKYLFLQRDKLLAVLTGDQANALLKQYDLLLPRKRNYYIETNYSHYEHLPYIKREDLKKLEEAILQIAPDYYDAYKAVMRRRSAHMFNMFITKKEIFDRYCAWMFPILFEVDRHIDTSCYSTAETRTVAYLGELMLDIWLEHNEIKYKELKVLYTEPQNWVKKVWLFLFRKMAHTTIGKALYG